jgi:transcriptional regulator with XRE-family HTH domain
VHEAETFGDRLRLLRNTAGVSGRQLGAQASMSQSKVSKLERGHTLPTRRDVDAIAKALQLSADVTFRLHHDVERIRDRSHKQGNRSPLDPFVAFAQCEMEARAVDTFSSVAIPAALQTATYTRLRLGRLLSKSQLDTVVMTRAQRRANAGRSDKSKHMRFLVTRSVFDQFPTDHLMWGHQLTAMEAFVHECDASVRVIDTEDAVRLGLEGPFQILDKRILAVDTPTLEVSMTEGMQVVTRRRAFDRAWRLATPFDALTHGARFMHHAAG